MTLTVTPAQPDHTAALIALLEEMDRFYGATEFDPIDVRTSQVHDALFSDTPAAYALLAWNEEQQLVGLASYSFLWPAAGLTRSLYMKELYVAESAQRQGIGRQLMASVFDVAIKAGCSRVEWATDEDNERAQRFYQALGHEVFPSKVSYRATGEVLQRHSP
ncbi:GNAT family N-acetyltransferase [Nonomuraea fuscirosea]|uniref:GNAT family N-acetyltransferase n=1 Tax=Nonomuraea fuscirosea TaxID=1291556 RepID=UPI0033C98BE2